MEKNFQQTDLNKLKVLHPEKDHKTFM